jgi:hypothetical protein
MVSIKSKSFTSGIITHPIQSGTNSVEYTFNHEALGAIPDYIEVAWSENESPDSHQRVPGFYPGANYGGQVVTFRSKTQSKVRMYRISGAVRDVYFIAMSLGANHK